MKHSNFYVEAKYNKIIFHFYRYLSGINFFIFSFLHVFLLILITYFFNLIFSYFWIYGYFWRSFFLYYILLQLLVLPILLVSFFTSLDLFYYNMFFESFFDDRKIFYKFFKGIHFLTALITPFVFLVVIYNVFYFLIKNPDIIVVFNINFVSNFAMLLLILLMLLRTIVCFFDQLSMIFCKKNIFTVHLKEKNLAELA